MGIADQQRDDTLSIKLSLGERVRVIERDIGCYLAQLEEFQYVTSQ